MKSIIDETLPFASGGRKAQAEQDQLEPFEAWKAHPDNKTRGALLKSVTPVIDRAVYTYAGPKPSPAVKSRARLMAMQAFDSYDPQKGTMKNHLMGQLRGIQRYAGQQNQIISVPERVTLDKLNLQQAEEQLRDNLGRDPSDMEIANHTGLSLKRISYIRGASHGVPTGSFVDESGEVYSPSSAVPGSADREDALRQLVYYDLGDVDQVVMDYTLGSNGSPKLSTQEIAKRLGITAGAVSQRKARIQGLLDEVWQMNLLGDEQ